MLGAGTVLGVENLPRQAAGVAFGVAPGLNPEVVKEAGRLGLPFIPGVITPTEIEQALALGVKIMKFFPAEAFGGLKLIKALSAPYAHAGVRFMPTGGVSAANLSDYLASEAVVVRRGDMDRDAGGHRRRRSWDQFRANSRAAVEMVRAGAGPGVGGAMAVDVLFVEERKQKILEHIATRRKATVVELCDLFRVPAPPSGTTCGTSRPRVSWCARMAAP